jgi:predicted AlkP superfamily phosphohydrolase/phosphomutase
MRQLARKVYDTLGLHGKVSLPQSVNWSKTRAYTTIRSTGEGVSINLAGREIDGIVDPGDYEKVRSELLDRLGSYVDPKTGKKPVKEIYKREEVFKGKFADTAPDILMVPNEGYSLTHAKAAIEDADWVSGDHRLEGTVVVVGPNVKPFETPPALIDMAPTLVAALGAPTAVKPSGRVLHEIVGAAELRSREASEESSAGAGIPGMGNEANVSDTEADEMEEHLRGLGYIE